MLALLHYIFLEEIYIPTDRERRDGDLSAKERHLRWACGEGFRIRQNRLANLIGPDRCVGTYL